MVKSVLIVVNDIKSPLSRRMATIARQQTMLDRALEQSFNDKARADRMEAALRSIAANTCCDGCQEAALVARAALTDKPDAGEGE